MSYAVTKSRVLQYIGIILIIGVFAGAYWYFQVFAGVKTNTSAVQPQGTGRLDSGLAGYWRLDDGSGTSATDASTNGNTGTLTNGPTWTTGQIGGVVDFDGTNDYIDLGSSKTYATVSAPFAVSFWMNSDDFSATNRIPFSFKTDSTTGWSATLLNSGGYTDLSFGKDTSSAKRFSFPGGFVTGTWYHVVISYNGSGINTTGNYAAYVNGVSVAVSASGTFAAIDNLSSIGRNRLNSGASADYWDGKLDEFRFYDRFLSADEVVQLYRLTTPTGVDTSLKGYWSFNAQDMNGTTAYDRSGAGNTGTLTNGPIKTVGVAGQALSFDGSNDYVDITDVTYNGEFTVSVWFNTSNNSQTATIFGDQSGGSGGGIKTGMTGGNFFVRPVSSSDNTIPVPTAGQWHHIVMTRDAASKIDFYVDGVGRRMFSDVAQSASFIPDKLGCNGSDGTQCFTGKLDEYRIYNRAITAADVKSLYDVGSADKANTSASQPQGTGRLDSGLSGYWPLDDASGNTAVDASTNGNNLGASATAAWTTGYIGGASSYNATYAFRTGADQAVHDVTDGSNFTLTGWFNRSTFTGDDFIIAKRIGISAANTGYALYIDDATDKVTFEVSDGTDEYQLESVSTFTATGWHHFTIVWNDASATETKMYIDGVAEAATTTGTFGNVNSLANAEVFTIAATSVLGTLWDGSLDEIRLYSRALSSDEVSQLYRLTTPTTVDTGLKGYWSFNAQDMNSTTAYDRSGAGNNGTLTNSPTKVVGKVGQALGIVASSSYVTIPDSTSLSPTAAFTLSFWIRPTATVTGSGKTLVLKSETSQRTFHVESTSTAAVRFNVASSIGDSGSNYGVSPDGVIVQNQWTYVTTVFDGAGSGNSGRAKIYINGVEQSVTYTGTIAATVPNATSSLVFGSLLTATYDEARFYDRALTAAEIKGLYDVSESDKTNSSVSQAQGTGRLDSGLAGYWKLDDGSGTSATDSSTNGSTGTLTSGPTWTTGQIGGAVDFDGTDDYITAGDQSMFEVNPNSISIGGWFKMDALPSGNRMFLVTKGGTTSYYEYELNVNGANSNKIRFTLGAIGGGAYLSTDSITAPTTGVWFHVVGVFDMNALSAKVYYNGVLEGTSTSTSGTIESTKNSNFNIGKRDDSAEAELNGQADEVRVYSRALSVDEVAQLYRLNTPTGTDTGLKGYWSFNGQDVSGTTAYDRSGAGNTGTLTNGPTKVIGKIGQALRFDMVDDYVNAGSASSLDDLIPLSVSVWIKPNSIGEGGNYGKIIGKDASLSAGGWQLSLASAAPCVSGGTPTSTNSILFSKAGSTASLRVNRCAADNTVILGEWQHFVATWDGSTGCNNTGVHIYKNGTEVGYTTTSSGACSDPAYTDAALDLIIGNRPTADRTFDGAIDEVRIYNRVLTAAEAAALYNQSR